MDTKQAKFILHSWRVSGADADDPHFTEALHLVDQDLDLADWFAREQALDAAIIRKLKDVPVPEPLRDTILAGRMVGPSPTARRRGAPLALAAVIAFLATLGAVWFGTDSARNGFAAYRTAMVENLSAGLHLEFAATDLTQVQDWLASRRSVAGYTVPEGLQQLPSLGCRTWKWHGQPVALICFSLGDGRAAHLLVVPRTAIPNPPPSDQPEFMTRESWMTASWTEGDFVYVVARKGDERSLRQLLGGKA